MASNHKAICDAVASAIVTLALTDYPNLNTIGSSRIKVRWGIEIEPIQLPAIFISPIGTKQMQGGTNERDDWGYPVSIYIVDRQTIEEYAPMDKVLEWRELIEKLFVSKRLTTVANLPTQYNGSPILDEAIVKAFQLLTQPIFLTFVNRETRG